MVFPLENLVQYTDNIYEITSAASHRAFQLAKIKDEEVMENDGKVVSVAARQLFDEEVTFRIES
ncbi:MAG: DNA-directed RNA polymerase subunit omega [Treponema sp.]|nr:DNA-directed RNA polymerase subunit omega [Treponema sp.]